MFSVSTRWCVVVLLAGLGVVSSFAREVAMDGFPERPVFAQKVGALFVAEVFATLEKTAQEGRAGARFTDGCWRLVWFYNAFAPPANATETQWEDWLKRFDRWEQAYPESVTARIARAQAWMAWAGPKRQRGQPEASEFFSRTDEARNILEANPAAKTCP